jgi:hypothetical protein
MLHTVLGVFKRPGGKIGNEEIEVGMPLFLEHMPSCGKPACFFCTSDADLSLTDWNAYSPQPVTGHRKTPFLLYFRCRFAKNPLYFRCRAFCTLDANLLVTL